MKTDAKARYQGYTFFFKEGFSWTDINSTFLKARLKTNGVFDVVSMSLFSMTQIPDWYYISMINSEFISLYVDNFINNTSHFQINDARQLPIIIPSIDELSEVKKIFENSIKLKKEAFSSKLFLETIEEKTLKEQNTLDKLTRRLYQI